MKKVALIVLFVCSLGVSSIGMTSTVDSYIGCIKQTSIWLFNNTGAEQQSSVMAATRLCVARPLGISPELLSCVKDGAVKLFNETMAKASGAVMSSTEICLLK